MLAAVDAEHAAHMAAVEGQTDAIIAGCFTLLPRLAEIESMVSMGAPLCGLPAAQLCSTVYVQPPRWRAWLCPGGQPLWTAGRHALPGL